MTLEISSHHLIELIKEDIKLNYLVFGLKDLGLECDPELLNLSSIIFKICEVDFEDLKPVEDYYNFMNKLRPHSLENLLESLDALSKECLDKLIK